MNELALPKIIEGKLITPRQIAAISRALEIATEPSEIREVQSFADMVEGYMLDTGLGVEKIRPVNELRMDARRKLGAALAVAERGKAPGKGKMISQAAKSFFGLLKSLGLQKDRAAEVQRIAVMPASEYERAKVVAREAGELLHVSTLVRLAEPWWRKERTKKARAAAIGRTEAAEFNAAKLGKHTIILADPPWRYEHPPMGASNRSIENNYPTMTLEEICALPVSEIANDDSVLFLWATAPKLVECMKVVEAWGFLYRTNLVWVKDKIGMGFYVRNQHELLLIAKRGELPPPLEDRRPSSVFDAPREEHSEKPEIVHDIIERMYPESRAKIELFARQERAGWKTWGNQILPAR